MPGEWKRLTGGLLRAVYPGRCPVCDGIVREWGEKICAECLPELKLLTPPWCMCCGRKVQEGEEYCGECGEKRHSFDRGRALYEYDSSAGAIYRFKYAGRREYADFFAEQMEEYLGEFIRSIRPDGLVPIPLHRARQVSRGYNQAALLAESLGGRMKIPVYSGMLIRARKTVPQKKLNAPERQNNLKKAFIMGRNDVKLKTIVVIDDIFTTGATIDEAARTLRDAGAEKVCFVTLACGAGAR
ncbi:MAG: ComF family protein [Lachnospiraceae bacterium]|nr:ComF family protein [Lachnospiraceae bacterium]